MSSETAFTEAWLPSDASFQFFTRLYAPQDTPKAILVFAHGFGEHIARPGYVSALPRFASRGVAVFAYDQRGFGQTAVKSEEKRNGGYGRTSWDEQMADVEWAVKEAKSKVADGQKLPVFVMGHSMGGGMVLGMCTRSPPRSLVSSLSGIIASSPLVLQSKPAPHLAKWLGTKISTFAPGMLIPASVKAEDLSHDPVPNKAYTEDPLIRPKGSLKGVGDMLNGGEQLLATNYKHWPPQLPVLFVHGSEDRVALCEATKNFHDKIPATDKKIRVFEHGYHELWHEPDGVKEEVADECINFILEHAQTNSARSVEEDHIAKL